MSAKPLQFGDWVVGARARGKISQGDLAARAGCSRVWLSFIECGHRIASDALKSRIEFALGETFPERALS